MRSGTSLEEGKDDSLGQRTSSGPVEGVETAFKVHPYL